MNKEENIINWWFQFNWIRGTLIPDQVFYVDDLSDGEDFISVFHWGTDIKVSKKYKTKYKLCSERCLHKAHFGSFENDVFECYRFDSPSSHPLDYLGSQLKILLGDVKHMNEKDELGKYA